MALWFNRGSTKNSSGAFPELVTLTSKVCVAPLAIERVVRQVARDVHLVELNRAREWFVEFQTGDRD